MAPLFFFHFFFSYSSSLFPSFPDLRKWRERKEKIREGEGRRIEKGEKERKERRRSEVAEEMGAVTVFPAIAPPSPLGGEEEEI